MRLALSCRDLAADRFLGDGARVFARARAAAEAGHRVFLVAEKLPPSRKDDRVAWVPTAPARPDHRYFAEAHRYADRVLDTLRTLGDLDVVEFLDAGAEGLSTIRAKRLLGEFGGTTLTVVRCPWSTAGGGPAAHRPLTAEHQFTGFAERYCAEHADVTTAVTTSVTPTASRTRPAVWRLGAYRPDAGIETFLDAAALVLDAHPGTRFELRGEDTPTDPLGRSYRDHLRRGLPAHLSRAVTFGGPPGDEPPGARCVLPAGDTECPSTAAFALARGSTVVAPKGSTAADVVERHGGGIVVAPDDPAALAEALFADAPECAESRPVLHFPQVEPVATAVEPGLVSVVIPLFDQGRFLDGALASVRAAGYADVEIVVVDDGSTDAGTVAAFDALTDVVKVRQPNAGLSAARNAGIAASRGEYVVPLDADDELPPGFLGPAVTALARHPELSYVVGHVRHTGLLDHVQAPLGHAGDVSTVVNTHGRATGVFRREALQAVGGYDESLPAYEDWDLYLRLARAGFEGDVAPVEGQRYRRHADSMTFGHSRDDRRELTQLLLKKHAADLPPDRSLPLLLTLAELWKSGYEPSASARLLEAGDG
ncbi:glycosyltransferase [Amycolatopsis tolypomycina]|uniref:glycosyltransferase n=1 Tax=Amycolatopsis tolypomycina TaxID=208445 RepID=UPI0033A4B102